MGNETASAKATRQFKRTYPKCSSIMGPVLLEQILVQCEGEPEKLPIILGHGITGTPDFLSDLARLEWSINKIKEDVLNMEEEIDQLQVNPSVILLKLSWKNLLSFLDSEEDASSSTPEPHEEFVLLWKNLKNSELQSRVASDEDLLVLKMIIEKSPQEEIASTAGLPIGVIDAAIDRAIQKGFLISPRSKIQRGPLFFTKKQEINHRFFSSPFFTLQWHITQTCDLHCKHCYDRSERSPMNLEEAIAVLDDLRAFCKSKFVKGQVSFTGGNPFLYPHFFELYQAAAERGFVTAILGNPVQKNQIKDLLAIKKPAFFQVSLEGLSEHNDAIRGIGTFKRAIEFLAVLKEFDIFSMVMLTLTQENIDQVLPLAEMLRHRTDYFTFNRLSMVGEGQALRLPPPEDFASFLDRYMKAAEENRIMGLKDNLINILMHKKGNQPFGGCAGFGCGAAFNFISVLPDGEAHACRKFPSPIGNVLEQSISQIYDSVIADRYRSGCNDCRSCSIRPVCGGCLAIAHSFGLNVFEERDPYCFMEQYR